MGTTDASKSFQRNAPQCFWMQAGVVRRKLCTVDFQCNRCRFDRALRKQADRNRRARMRGRPVKGARGAIVAWEDKLKERPPWQRPCVHHMKGHISFRACTNDYRCANCEFEQYFNDQFRVYTTVMPVTVQSVEGFELPHGVYLHHGHTWLKVEENSEVRVGLDDFALRLLGPPERIDAPLMGKTVHRDTAAFSVHRGKHVARALSPVTGVVTATNPILREKGQTAHRAPYTDGWIARIYAPDLRSDLRQLRLGAEALDFLEAEISGLYAMIESQAGPLATDGGRLGHDIFGGLPQIGWDRLTRRFLRT